MTQADSQPVDDTDTALSNQSTILGLEPVQGAVEAGTRKRVTEIWSEMREKWSRGEPVRAEEYLTSDYLANSSHHDVVDVIYAEYDLAEQYGRRPEVEDYVRRFPAYASSLLLQIDFQTAFDSETLPVDGPSTIPDSRSASGSETAFPQQFGRYLLVAPLDSGAQSRVFRAIHPDLGQEIVLKISSQRQDSQSPAADQRLQEEARLLASLSHPHLARILDAGVVEGSSYLALEYVRGQPLSQYGAAALPQPAEACRLVAKLASAVSQVHSRGILHLDIKPKNIVLDEHGEPRLLDFGLSRLQNAWTEALGETSVSGTLAFMAPEQARGDSSQFSAATDVFALGGVLYFLLTGRPLYEGNSVGAVLTLAQKCHWNREALKSSPASLALQSLCERALDSNPKHRFASADAFARELESFLTSRSPRTARWVAVGLSVVAILVFGIVWLRGGSPEPSVAPQPIALDLKIEVWNRERFMSLSNAVPLRNGDELQSAATIPPDTSAAWYLITSEGRVRQLHQYPPSAELRRIRYPDNALVPLVGPPGTECLLFVVSNEFLPTADDIEANGKTTQEWPHIPEQSIIRMTNNRVAIEQSGRDFGPPSDRPPAEVIVRQKLEAIQSFLEARQALFEGIAFSHAK